MGFLKDIAGPALGLINPVGLIGTGASMGMDYWAMTEQQKEASRAREQADRLNTQNYMAQKEFAQNSIRWRVEDAIAAGLHPLAAIGASGTGYSPSSVVGDTDNSKSEMIGRMGQNISRAISAGSTRQEREYADRQRLMWETQLKGSQLDNEYKQVLIDKARAPNPPIPNTVDNNINQDEIPDTVYRVNNDGSLSPEVPERLGESLEASPGVFGLNMGEVEWWIRNKGIPRLLPDKYNVLPYPDSRYKIEPDKYWDWNQLRGAWVKKKFKKYNRYEGIPRTNRDYSY